MKIKTASTIYRKWNQIITKLKPNGNKTKALIGITIFKLTLFLLLPQYKMYVAGSWPFLNVYCVFSSNILYTFSELNILFTFLVRLQLKAEQSFVAVCSKSQRKNVGKKSHNKNYIKCKFWEEKTIYKCKNV